MLITDLHILAHLIILNVGAELILVANDLLLQSSRFFHQVFVELILMHFATFFGKKLHLLLNSRKDDDLFVLIEDSITTLVKYFKEILRIVYP